jgi:uncharacterized protein YndB with AHSA1/START domain
VTVSVTIAAPLERVWEAVSDLSSHVEWMADAESIAFRTDQRSGVGTIMEVVTTVGPLRTTDVMEVTEWVERASIGGAHVGVVSGSGRFSLTPTPDGTLFTWSERLRFPWFFAGPMGAWIARPIFQGIWRRNLARLKAHIER